MTTTSQPSRRRSHVLRRTAATAAVAATLIGGSAAIAQAAGYIYPGQTTSVGTNFFGPSRICVQNYGSTWGSFTLYANFANPEQNWVPPYGVRCREAWWFGQQVGVRNTGTTVEYAYRAW